jgi:CHAT domain-containing protein
LKVYQLEIKRKAVAERAELFRQQLARRDMGFAESAQQLYDLLLRPAREQLRGRDALIIVPDGMLWNLPFQALQSAPGHYLLEDYAVSYAPSLTVLREMQRPQRRESNAAPAEEAATLLAVGNPALGQQTLRRARSGFMAEELSPLPEAENQVVSLGKLYGAEQSKVYVGANAREDRVKAEAGRFQILQFATHGILNDRNPMYSHVLLSQPEGSNDDGLLEAWEMMKLNLHADMVVLSACETALGRVGAGEGVIGMTWALFVAGSPTTVVSQWKVESASTTELMLEFHRNLKAGARNPPEPMLKARALQQASLKLLRSNGQYRHPFYWAGFVVVGKAT